MVEDLSSSVEAIGPSKALEMLEANTANFRKPDRRRIDQYAKEMTAGKWELNGEAIKFTSSGVLLDGQHRLLAIAKSGVTVSILVIRGISSSGRTNDRGKQRTITQWCQHAGFKNAKTVASAAKLCVAYEKGLWDKPFIRTSDVLDSEIFDFIDRYSEPLQAASTLSLRTKKVISSSITCSIFLIGANKQDPSVHEEILWFSKALASGENLSSNDAVFILRERLMRQTDAKKISPYNKRWIATIAWNKTVLGEPCNHAMMRVRMVGPRHQSPPSRIETLDFNADQCS